MIDKIKISFGKFTYTLRDAETFNITSDIGHLLIRFNAKYESVYLEPNIEAYFHSGSIDEQILKLDTKEQERIYKLLYNLGHRINK